MKMNKQPLRVRLLICIGLLLTIMPMLFKEYIAVPDFLRGTLAGLGLVMEIAGLILMKRIQKTGSSC
jgi:hypothetical protein